MRIVAGAHRGRSLVAPKGHSTRPTADRARQALFNVLEHAPWSPGLAGLQVLDLFAGSGALGLEALSRGAAFCLFADTDPAAAAANAANLAALRLEDRAIVRRWDATRLPHRISSPLGGWGTPMGWWG
jgi:16S rRNA (guanine966-N2)-methyltransferase